MPNYCSNYLWMDGSVNDVKNVINFVKSNENEFDFNKIVPMPDYIYRDILGSKESALYGENNWYDWACKNWGTKWNSMDVEVYNDKIYFLTAWTPCEPVIAALARMFPSMRFTYSFYECGTRLCGKRIYENGKNIFSFDGDYAENPLCEEDDEQANEYTLSDPLFPVQDNGVFEAVREVKKFNGATLGKLYYREYLNGKIAVMTDGCFAASENFSFDYVSDQLTVESDVA